MFSSLFDGSTIPMLEQVVQFTEARHGVLAGNIANMDTPGYRTRDLSPELFQSRLQEALETKRKPPARQYALVSEAMAGTRTCFHRSNQSQKSVDFDGMEKVREGDEISRRRWRPPHTLNHRQYPSDRSANPPRRSEPCFTHS